MSDTTRTIERRCRHCGNVVPTGFAFCSHCGASVARTADTSDPVLSKLRVLFEKQLEIEREIGRGGMASVYLAFDVALERRVAVKALLPQIAADPQMAARFIREARAVAALQHPHVVSVFGVRVNEEISALVMQYVEGRSLDVVLKEERKLALPVVGLVLSQVAAGLQHAHERGIVHRDVKPSNVLLDRDGRAVVSDFGLAQQQGGTRITESGLVVGTLAYMSPEQRTLATVGPPADQYAFGVMAFEMIAGRLPFVGTLPDMMRAHLSAPPPPLKQFRPDVSDAVEAVVARMLAKEPAQRYPHLREAESVFHGLIPDESSTTVVIAALARSATRGAQPAVGEVERETAPFTIPDARVSVEPTTPTARPWRALVAVATAVVVLGGGMWGLRAWRDAPTGAASEVHSISPAASATPAFAPAGSHPRAGASAAPTKAIESSPSPRPQAAVRDTTPATLAARGLVTVGSGARVASADAAAISRDSVLTNAPPPRTDATTAPVSAKSSPPAPALADARASARAFATMLNQRRWQDVERLGTIAGDTARRAEFIRLVRTAPDFAAGFDRVASAPEVTDDQFATDFVLDLEWRGGRRLVEVTLRAAYRDGAWQIAGFRLAPSQ